MAIADMCKPRGFSFRHSPKFVSESIIFLYLKAILSLSSVSRVSYCSAL